MEAIPDRAPGELPPPPARPMGLPGCCKAVRTSVLSARPTFLLLVATPLCSVCLFVFPKGTASPHSGPQGPGVAGSTSNPRGGTRTQAQQNPVPLASKTGSKMGV